MSRARPTGSAPYRRLPYAYSHPRKRQQSQSETAHHQLSYATSVPPAIKAPTSGHDTARTTEAPRTDDTQYKNRIHLPSKMIAEQSLKNSSAAPNKAIAAAAASRAHVVNSNTDSATTAVPAVRETQLAAAAPAHSRCAQIDYEGLAHLNDLTVTVLCSSDSGSASDSDVLEESLELESTSDASLSPASASARSSALTKSVAASSVESRLMGVWKGAVDLWLSGDEFAEIRSGIAGRYRAARRARIANAEAVRKLKASAIGASIPEDEAVMEL